MKLFCIKATLIFIISLNISFSQSFGDIFKQISANNKEIIAYKEYIRSQNYGNRTNFLPMNPKVEYSYLKGNSAVNGIKDELIISQPFEFPTNYFLKSDIASIKNNVNELLLAKFIRNKLAEVNKLLIEYIYLTKKVNELEKRSKNADDLLNAIKTKFEKSDVGVLELNKAKSNYSLQKSRYNLAKVELNSISQEIIMQNGGKEISLAFIDYPVVEFNSDFESSLNELSKSDIESKLMEKEIELSSDELSLAKSGWLPNFEVGYRSETEPDIGWKGIQVQMSLPLFENSNKVPLKRSELDFSEIKYDAHKIAFVGEKRRLFDKVKLLKMTLDEQSELTDESQLELNKKSYDSGYISLTQFYNDNTIYYDIQDSFLEIEKEYNSALSELYMEIIIK